jgi:hypothetical protein
MVRSKLVLAYALTLFVSLAGWSIRSAQAEDLSSGEALALASPHGTVSTSEEFLLSPKLPAFSYVGAQWGNRQKAGISLESDGDLIVKPGKRTVVQEKHCRIVIPAGTAALIRVRDKRLIVRNLSEPESNSLLVYFEKTPCKVRAGQEAEIASELLTLRRAGD